MRILVVSPIASHPKNQGNSFRISSICYQMQSLGHIVHFLYYPLEGLTKAQRDLMASSWDFFHTMDCDLPPTYHKQGDYYFIDDWFDPKLGEFVKKLHKRWDFDAVWVNYVWFSGVLNYVPDEVFKVVDTHDVFGDRHCRFLELGLKPEWFYTSVDEERRGLERANLVVSIQDEEEIYFKKLLQSTKTNVVTIGHIMPPRFIPSCCPAEVRKIGYLGSGNPFNVHSIKEFSSRLLSCQESLSKYSFYLAGTICNKIQDIKPFTRLGELSCLDVFYENMDAVINPMRGGTGLKIKTLEALSYGVNFIGTKDAFVGIQVVNEDQCALQSCDEFFNDLDFLFSDDLFFIPSKISKDTFLAYIRNHAKILSKILANK